MPLARGARLARRATALVGALAGCSGARPATTFAPAAACTIVAAHPASGDTLSLATFAAVDPTHAPVAANGDERLVFAQLYESLIALDCDGRLRPALARSWAFDATRTGVRLTLRDDARFSDGAPVTAGDVVAAWRATAARSDALAALVRPIADGATVVDEHTLTLSLPETDLPMLADPALAVYRQHSDSPWPAGTGRYQVVRQDARGRLVLAPVASRTDPVLVTRPIADARDAIDAGVDVLVTADPVAVSYAEARGGLEAVPLPWTWTYALAVPHLLSNGGGALPAGIDSVGFRAALARDAVHAEARGAEPPFWWNHVTDCEPTLKYLDAIRGSNRIVYHRDDRVARGLAERLVALGRGATAAGLAPEDFARAFVRGEDLAYVLALPRAPLAQCIQLGTPLAAAWVTTGRGGLSSVLPLVDTRQRAIVSRDRVSATILADGTLLLGGSTP